MSQDWYRAGLHLHSTGAATLDAFLDDQRAPGFTRRAAADLYAQARTWIASDISADPLYGGNRDKAGWKMIGFGGVVAVHQQNVEKYRGRKFPVDPLGIADMS